MSKKKKQTKVSVLTLGCSKNLVDSEHLVGLLDSNNIKVTNNLEESDTLVINTCGFIAPAKDESVNVILEAEELKRQGKIKNIIVMGCLSQRYMKELKEQLPDVDAIYGVDSNAEVLKTIKDSDDFCMNEDRILLTPPHYAYLKIAEGCNHECSFCAIPLIRGHYRSREMNDIVNEAKELVAKGVKEINLIAQDTSYYGKDWDGKSHLAELIDRISDIKDLPWLRIYYAYPTAFPEEVLEVIANKPNICNYVDIPYQHISDKILKSMRRGTNSEYIRKLTERIRRIIPNAAIRSTFIVGYPGETEDDFKELYNFIEEYRLDRVGVFTYSHEENTHAYSLIETVIQEEKERRKEELMLLQQKISLEKNQEKIGKIFKVFVDEVSGHEYIGRTEYDAPEVDNLVHFTSRKRQHPGDFVDVKITKAEEYDIFGEVI